MFPCKKSVFTESLYKLYHRPDMLPVLALPIFNEAETGRQPINIEPKLDVGGEKGDTPTRKPQKTKGKREKDLAGLPKQVVEYKLSPEEQICPICNNELHEVRPEVRRELEVIPAKVIVKESRMMIYSCRNCEKEGISVPQEIQTFGFPQTYLRLDKSAGRSGYKNPAK